MCETDRCPGQASITSAREVCKAESPVKKEGFAQKSKCLD
jgi:hypothetical protein